MRPQPFFASIATLPRMDSGSIGWSQCLRGLLWAPTPQDSSGPHSAELGGRELLKIQSLAGQVLLLDSIEIETFLKYPVTAFASSF